MGKRIQLEILEEILQLCKVPRTKTEVVYLCNLNFNIYKKYVARLEEMGCIHYDGKYYTITDKGYARLNELVLLLTSYEEMRVY